MPFRNGNRLGWCNSILWRVKAFVSPTNRNLSLPLTSSLKRTLEKVKSAKYLRLSVDNKLNLNTHFMLMLLRRLTQLLFSSDPAGRSKRLPIKLLWDPSLNVHLLFRINIKKKIKKKKKNEHTHRSSAKFVWNSWPQSKCKGPFILHHNCVADRSTNFCRKSLQHHCISN